MSTTTSTSISVFSITISIYAEHDYRHFARCHGCEDVFCSFAKKKDEGDGDANGGVFY